MKKPEFKYIIRNITTRDISIGDLRTKIPSGKSRDLLGKNGRMSVESVLQSEMSGSISKHLGKGLVLVCKVVPALTPLDKIALEFFQNIARSGFSYILRNITARDVNLGDCRMKIPAGKCRDLLGKNSHLNIDDILKSEQTGSISKYLGRGLIKVYKAVPTLPPPMEVLDPSAVTFPQRRKAYIIIDVGDIDEEMSELVLSEDEEYLRQLDIEGRAADGDLDIPIVAPD